MKTLIAIIALSCVSATPPEPSSVFRVSSEGSNYIRLTTQPPTNIHIQTRQGPISISYQTGEVTLPDGLSISDASREFWMRLAEALPYAREAIIAGQRDARTVVWGEDFLKAHPELFKGPRWEVKKFHFVMIGFNNGPSYEFGLRSDGVVVWREIKK